MRRGAEWGEGPTSEAASRGAGVPASDEAGIDFLVIEYLEGETLAARVDQRAAADGPGLALRHGDRRRLPLTPSPR